MRRNRGNEGGRDLRGGRRRRKGWGDGDRREKITMKKKVKYVGYSVEFNLIWIALFYKRQEILHRVKGGGEKGQTPCLNPQTAKI